MRVLTGLVSSRFNAATENLETVRLIVLERTGLQSFVPGTLNVTLEYPYFVHADCNVKSDEYFTGEVLKLQRCRCLGLRMFIMRPDSHELKGNDAAKVLELISEFHLRQTFGLTDGALLDVEVEGDDAWWDAPENRP